MRIHRSPGRERGRSQLTGSCLQDSRRGQRRRAGQDEQTQQGEQRHSGQEPADSPTSTCSSPGGWTLPLLQAKWVSEFQSGPPGADHSPLHGLFPFDPSFGHTGRLYLRETGHTCSGRKASMERSDAAPTTPRQRSRDPAWSELMLPSCGYNVVVVCRMVGASTDRPKTRQGRQGRVCGVEEIGGGSRPHHIVAENRATVKSHRVACTPRLQPGSHRRSAMLLALSSSSWYNSSSQLRSPFAITVIVLAGWLLRTQGSGIVYPFVLARATARKA